MCVLMRLSMYVAGLAQICRNTHTHTCEFTYVSTMFLWVFDARCFYGPMLDYSVYLHSESNQGTGLLDDDAFARGGGAAILRPIGIAFFGTATEPRGGCGAT